jgi:hypothetical protein
MSTRSNWRMAERIFTKFYLTEYTSCVWNQTRLTVTLHDHLLALCERMTTVVTLSTPESETGSKQNVKHALYVRNTCSLSCVFETSEQQKLFILSQHHKKRTYQTCYGMRIRPMFILYIKQLLSAYCGKKKKKLPNGGRERISIIEKKKFGARIKFDRACCLKQYLLRFVYETRPVRVSTMTIYPERFRCFLQSLYANAVISWSSATIASFVSLSIHHSPSFDHYSTPPTHVIK